MSQNSQSGKIVGVVVIIAAIVILGLVWMKKTVGPVNVPPRGEVTSVPAGEKHPILDKLSVPEGFAMNIFAENAPWARVIEFDPAGRVLVSQTEIGKITALEDIDDDGVSDKQKILLEGLNKPHGLAFDCRSGKPCALYVAERDRLTKYAYDENDATVSAPDELLKIESADADNHFTRTLLFLPSPDDDTLLISVGSSCNVCYEKGEMRGKIIFYNVKTGETGEYARGLRNSVFMTLNPVSGKVFATEMGRDRLGDDIPPDEINLIEKGRNYGWPICYGKNIHDDEFDPVGESIPSGASPIGENTPYGASKNILCKDYEPSFVDLQAHSAPLGLAFIPEDPGWLCPAEAPCEGGPDEYWYNLLIAFHGSWNRSVPTGYKIVHLKMNAKGEYLGTEDFITGWLTESGEKLGRPVDIKVLPGGVAYISDDMNGFVYRLARER